MAEVEQELTFGRQVFRRAWSSAWAFFGSWQRDAGLFVFFTVVGGVPYYWRHGWPDTWSDTLDAVLSVAAPAIVLWLLLFVWHLWLAPSAIAYEAAKARSNAGNVVPAGPPKPPTLLDAETTSLAGKVVRLGEVVRAWGFVGITRNTTEDMYLRDLLTSAHVIWTNQEALQLRREFENRVGRVIAANSANNMTERDEAVKEMDEVIVALNKILLGQS
jgi:hypothetical protein